MTVLVAEAKALARQWAADEAPGVPGFLGAYLAGSVNWMPDDAPFPETSDLDLNVVVSSPCSDKARSKSRYHGLLIEVSYIPFDRLRSPEAVLADYHLAGGFRTPSVILDPSGRLSALQSEVSRHFADPVWVRRRCEHAATRVTEQLAALREEQPLPELAIGWIFPAGVTTHVLLAAGLRNPTVRRRYAEVRRLLADYCRLDFHEELLDLLGCARMNRERVERHLAAAAEAFDAASAHARTSFVFSADVTDASRPVAIDGSRELIEQGLHREAVFWIAVTHSRCQVVLSADAPPQLTQRLKPAYADLLADLGIATWSDIQRRAKEVRRVLPRVWEVAEEIMARNQGLAPSA